MPVIHVDACRYNTGEYLFDIHPPLGKLTFVWIGKVFGYDPSPCKYDFIGQVFHADCKYMIFRYVAGNGGSHRAFVGLSFVAIRCAWAARVATKSHVHSLPRVVHTAVSMSWLVH